MPPTPETSARTTTPTTPATTSPVTTGPPDPRHGFETVSATVGSLIADVESGSNSALDGATPCPDFTVADLIDHLIMVMRRVAVIGNGGHFAEIEQETIGDGRAHAFRRATADATAAWTDTDRLDLQYEVPWGEIPGTAVVYTYTAEVAVHGHDLATATGRPIVIDDEALHGALAAAKFLPAEGRGTPEVPFDPVVDPGPRASVLDQLAGWMGRKVETN